MLQTAWILLPTIPNLIFKPFALWVVGGYTDDLLTISAKQRFKRTTYFDQTVTVENPRFEEGDGDMAGPSRKRTMLYGDETDSSNANEQYELNMERRALLLKSVSSESECEPCESGPSSSRITTSVRQGPAVLRQSIIAEAEE